MDKYEIYIYRDYVWEIRALGLDDYNDVPPFHKPSPEYNFGIMKIFPNDKIAYIFDSAIHDEDLELAKEDEMMRVICEFDVTIVEFNDSESKEQLICSLYDALIYIKQKWREIEKQTT